MIYSSRIRISVRSSVSLDFIILMGVILVLISDMNTKVRPHIQNGNIGLFVNNQNSSTISQSYISQLWSNGKLLNPVIGMRFNPENPKLTIGALDPADYEGEINWVQMETPDPSWDLPNVFKMDGFKGYDGSLLNIGSSDGSAGLNSRACGVNLDANVKNSDKTDI